MNKQFKKRLLKLLKKREELIMEELRLIDKLLKVENELSNLKDMKVTLNRHEFIPFALVIAVETHEDLKALYSATYDNKTLDCISRELMAYSNENKVSL